MASLKKRKEYSGLDLIASLKKAIGINDDYNPEDFAQFWIDSYNSEDPDVYETHGDFLYELVQKLEEVIEQTESTAIVPAERTTKVWCTEENIVRFMTDSEIVDKFLSNANIYKVSSLLTQDYLSLEMIVLEDIHD